jgi:hypothetical protein
VKFPYPLKTRVVVLEDGKAIVRFRPDAYARLRKGLCGLPAKRRDPGPYPAPDAIELEGGEIRAVERFLPPGIDRDETQPELKKRAEASEEPPSATEPEPPADPEPPRGARGHQPETVAAAAQTRKAARATRQVKTQEDGP